MFSNSCLRLTRSSYLSDTASGNNGRVGVKFPAAYPLVVGVGALSSDYTLWSGSNWGDQVELVAPGNNVLSTAVSGKGEFIYQQWSGTSMATPHVAGVAVRVAGAPGGAVHLCRRGFVLTHFVSL